MSRYTSLRVTVVIFLLIGLCASIIAATPSQTTTTSAAKMSIGFGSCNKHDEDQTQVWTQILASSKEEATKTSDEKILSVFIHLGDIIYADYAPYYPYLPNHVALPEEKRREIWHHMRHKNPYYQNFVSKTRKIVGIYDDHDMGLNDEGARCADKTSSQQFLLDFLDLPSIEEAEKTNNKESIVRRKRDGVYNFNKISFKGFENDPNVKPVCVILLDFRSHRDPPKATDGGSNILGEEQWRWLEAVLKTGQDPDVELQTASSSSSSSSSSSNNIDDVCSFTILGSSTQVLLDSAPMETWGEYPNERNRLLRLLAKSKARRLFIISGDIHMTEAAVLNTHPSSVTVEGLLPDERNRSPLSSKSQLFERCPESIWPDQKLYDITSSGLTHHEIELFFGDGKYDKLFPSHRRLAPGSKVVNNAGMIDVSCENVRDPESCKITVTSYESPSMKVIFKIDIEFAPKSKRIADSNKYYREHFPHCHHLHDIENSYTLADYPSIWTWSLDSMKIYFPAVFGEWFRLELVFAQIYSVLFVVLIVVVALLRSVWRCALGKKKVAIIGNKSKKE